MNAAALLSENKNPSDDDILCGDVREHLPLRLLSAHFLGDQVRRKGGLT